jgi:hypothetical protein
MELIKSWIGNYLTSAMKNKLQNKMTLATVLMVFTFIISLIGFILSIVAISKLNAQLSSINLTEKVIIQGISYYRIL